MYRILGLTLVLLLMFAACGDDDEDSTSTTAPTAVTSATATSPSGGGTASAVDPTAASQDVATAADNIILALQTHDRDRLHDGSGDHLRTQDREHDFDRLLECVPEGAMMTMVDREVTIDGDTASVVHTFEITTADGETSTVERTMVFQLDDAGKWVLSEFPECPFHE